MSFSWDRDEMIAHGVHLMALIDEMNGWDNPGVGTPDDYGDLVGQQIVGALKPVAEALFGAVDATRSATVARHMAVMATAEAYSANEQTNRAAATRLTKAMGDR